MVNLLKKIFNWIFPDPENYKFYSNLFILVAFMFVSLAFTINWIYIVIAIIFAFFGLFLKNKHLKFEHTTRVADIKNRKNKKK